MKLQKAREAGERKPHPIIVSQPDAAVNATAAGFFLGSALASSRVRVWKISKAVTFIFIWQQIKLTLSPYVRYHQHQLSLTGV